VEPLKKIKGSEKDLQLSGISQDKEDYASASADDLAGDQNESTQEAFEFHPHDQLDIKSSVGMRKALTPFFSCSMTFSLSGP
jgi:hypothetical protein